MEECDTLASLIDEVQKKVDAFGFPRQEPCFAGTFDYSSVPIFFKRADQAAMFMKHFDFGTEITQLKDELISTRRKLEEAEQRELEWQERRSLIDSEILEKTRTLAAVVAASGSGDVRSLGEDISSVMPATRGGLQSAVNGAKGLHSKVRFAVIVELTAYRRWQDKL